MPHVFYLVLRQLLLRVRAGVPVQLLREVRGAHQILVRGMLRLGVLLLLFFVFMEIGNVKEKRAP